MNVVEGSNNEEESISRMKDEERDKGEEGEKKERGMTI